MALGTRFDFDMTRGDDRELTFTLVDQQGAPVDPTGQTVEWALFRQSGGAPLGDALVTKTLGGGIVIVNGPAGELRVDIGPGDTSPLVAGDYYHEVQTIVGKTTTPLFGTLTLVKDGII